MRLLADENIARAVIAALRKDGHDVITIHELRWRGSSDEAIIAYAKKTERVILTHDTDFLYQRLASILLLRFARQDPITVASALIVFLDRQPFRKKMQRKPFIVILSEEGATIR